MHWIGPLLSSTAALVLLILAAWLSIPSTLELASVALVMSASMLTPIKPLDGGFVATGTAGAATGLALVSASLFLVSASLRGPLRNETSSSMRLL